jgi:hypothetical protein
MFGLSYCMVDKFNPGSEFASQRFTDSRLSVRPTIRLISGFSPQEVAKKMADLRQ